MWSQNIYFLQNVGMPLGYFPLQSIKQKLYLFYNG